MSWIELSVGGAYHTILWRRAVVYGSVCHLVHWSITTIDVKSSRNSLQSQRKVSVLWLTGAQVWVICSQNTNNYVAAVQGNKMLIALYKLRAIYIDIELCTVHSILFSFMWQSNRYLIPQPKIGWRPKNRRVMDIILFMIHISNKYISSTKKHWLLPLS